jgi:hypothetical protein
MATLWDKLTEMLPKILPSDPSEAINGTGVFNKVRSQLSEYAEASIRQHLSQMSADPTSVVAKVDKGHGYYLRPTASESVNGGAVCSSGSAPVLGQNGMAAEAESPAGRESQPEEKFRALYMRYARQQNSFPMLVDHTRAEKQEAGTNKWKYPDVVVLDWDVGGVVDDGYRLDRHLLDVKCSLGEQPFRLTSVEFKTRLTVANFRECFFQCVSNSKWAHHAVLAIAEEITDTIIATELRRLGTSYDVTVQSYCLNSAFLKDAPPATEIRGMTDESFDELAKGMRPSPIATGRQRTSLDWEHIRDMQGRTKDCPLVQVDSWLPQRRTPVFVRGFRQDHRGSRLLPVGSDRVRRLALNGEISSSLME